MTLDAQLGVILFRDLNTNPPVWEAASCFEDELS